MVFGDVPFIFHYQQVVAQRRPCCLVPNGSTRPGLGGQHPPRSPSDGHSSGCLFTIPVTALTALLSGGERLNSLTRAWACWDQGLELETHHQFTDDANTDSGTKASFGSASTSVTVGPPQVRARPARSPLGAGQALSASGSAGAIGQLSHGAACSGIKSRGLKPSCRRVLHAQSAAMGEEGASAAGKAVSDAGGWQGWAGLCPPGTSARRC